ncbi:MAG TPA: hypothetical protein DEB62_12560 [Vibrio sp.]|uniref:Uncharacterized protein n=1 Tax=Vibrio casei TaxID=673372 RepID=A0A368LPR0_9VIBR|nr:hypothetical protein CIK83_09995 [Vibrio casei]HBV77200.1 hypothetical protein [Vibrio sp.]
MKNKSFALEAAALLAAFIRRSLYIRKGRDKPLLFDKWGAGSLIHFLPHCYFNYIGFIDKDYDFFA